MPPRFASIEKVVQSMAAYPHSSVETLAQTIDSDPATYGKAISKDTIYQVVNHLRELNLVRVHFNDEGEALYEFGNQPHPVLVCMRCPSTVPRQDTQFLLPNGPFVQLAKSKDGRIGNEHMPLLQLAQLMDFTPITYRFEVLGYCRTHASDVVTRERVMEFYQWLMYPETLEPEFKGRLALDDDELLMKQMELVKKLSQSTKVGATTKRVIDQPTQYMMDQSQRELAKQDAELAETTFRFQAGKMTPKEAIDASLLEFLYNGALARRAGQQSRAYDADLELRAGRKSANSTKGRRS